MLENEKPGKTNYDYLKIYLTTTTMNKLIIEPIQKRFSPMIFDSKTIELEILQILMESGSFAASSYNSQPWRFIYAYNGTEEYQVLRNLLSEYNQAWSESAPVLMLGIAHVKNEKGETNVFAMHDLGQAVSSMAIQASAMGLQLHQMAGYDMLKAIEVLKIPDDFAPASIMAVGYPGDKELLKGHFKERAFEARQRKPVADFSGGITMFS